MLGRRSDDAVARSGAERPSDRWLAAARDERAKESWNGIIETVVGAVFSFAPWPGAFDSLAVAVLHYRFFFGFSTQTR